MNESCSGAVGAPYASELRITVGLAGGRTLKTGKY